MNTAAVTPGTSQDTVRGRPRTVQPTTTGTVSDTRHVSASRAPLSARIRLLVDLRLVEVANALGLGLGLGLRTLRLIAVVAPTLGGAVTFLVSAVVAALAAKLIGDDSVPFALSTLVLFMTYSGITAVIGELLSRFRYGISGHPNRALFRAIDVPAHLVFLVYAGPRIIGQSLAWTSVGVGAALGLTVSGAIAHASVSPPLIWCALVCTPVALGLATVAAGLFGAARPPTTPVRPATVAILAVVAGMLVGGSATTWLVLPIVRNTATGFGDDARALLILLAAGGPILLVASAVLGAIFWGHLHARSFRTVAAWSPRYALKFRRSSLLSWVHLLGAQRVTGWRYRVQVRIMGALVGAASAVAAARLIGLPTPTESLTGAVLLPTVGFISVIVGLTISDLTLGDLGFHAFGAHLRHAVECGVPVRTAVLAHALALALPVSLLSALLSLVMSLILGVPLLTPVLVGLGALASSVIALHVLPPPRGADGTPTESLFTGLATLLLAALPVAVPLAFPAAQPWFIPACVALLLGSAAVCVRQQLIRHP